MKTLLDHRLLQFEENFKCQNGQTGIDTQDPAPENEPDDSSSSSSISSSSSSDSRFDSNPGKSQTKKHKKIEKIQQWQCSRPKEKMCKVDSKINKARTYDEANYA